MKKLTFILLLGLLIVLLPNTSDAATCSPACPSGYQCIDGGTYAYCAPPSSQPSQSGNPNNPQIILNKNATGNPTGNQTCTNCNLGYVPLEPIPGITSIAGQAPDFPTLLKNIYKIAIIIGALFSVLMLTISGIRYMLSDVVTDKAKALTRIRACIYGLILIAASWLILNTINPQLVQFNLRPGTVVINGPSGSGTGVINTGNGGNSPISGLPVDQQGCNNVRESQTFWGTINNDGAFWYNVTSSSRSLWNNMSLAQQKQQTQQYLTLCAQNKFI